MALLVDFLERVQINPHVNEGLHGRRNRLFGANQMGPTLYALCVLPFAGKSTIARRLAGNLGAPIVRLDDVNGERGLGLDDRKIPEPEWDHTYAEAYRRLDAFLASGQSVIFDHVNFTRAERDRLRAIAAGRGARVEINYVEISPTEARRRLLANRQSGERNDVHDDDFELVVHNFEAPGGERNVVRARRWVELSTARSDLASKGYVTVVGRSDARRHATGPPPRVLRCWMA